MTFKLNFNSEVAKASRCKISEILDVGITCVPDNLRKAAEERGAENGTCLQSIQEETIQWLRKTCFE
ncbi:hypothetical protein CEXT_624811 [Caerostris extrusa]|uniref:Uncharacterized protein n=1 Tax=Caerostris extrusa TaxID=172846 RepID=A0AAV4Y1Q5_CAEEX|nr:hypothetical protein CEXT_624811 [Caerostris extrusa]